jgi:hypothetical protein
MLCLVTWCARTERIIVVFVGFSRLLLPGILFLKGSLSDVFISSALKG